MLDDDNYVYIDYEDLEKVSKYYWSIGFNGFPTHTNQNGKSILISRFIINAPDDMWVDHINGDRIDNRKCNLRLCSRTENSKNRKRYKNNTSGYKGVTKHKNGKMWNATIINERKRYNLGKYNNIIDAALAYNKGAEHYFKEFANINIIYFPSIQTNNIIPDITIEQKRKLLQSNNTSGFRGVSWSEHGNAWHAKISYNNKDIYIGSSSNIIEAAKMYDIAAIRLYGKNHEMLNFKDIDYDIDNEILPMDNPLNARNTSGYTGIKETPGGKWRSSIEIDRKKINLGTYDDPIDAAKIYDRALLHFKKGHTELNFPNDIDWSINLEYYLMKPKRTQQSKYKGITFVKNRWIAKCCYNNKKHYCGSSTSEIESAIIYDEVATNHSKQKILNFPHYTESCNIDPSIINDIHIIPSST